MQKLILRMVLLLLLVSCACAPRVWAQEKEASEPEFTMPCREVLKLGLDKFTNYYGEKTNDYSTYGMKQAFAYYVDCKRPANDALSKSLPQARRKQADAVREELGKIGNAAWDMAYISAGGGTMYGLLSVGAYAAREDFMATLIKALASERKQPAARRRAATHLAKARKLLARSSRMPKLEVFGDESLADKQKQYRDKANEARDAVQRLQAIIGDLPDAAAELAAKRMAEELDAEVEG